MLLLIRGLLTQVYFIQRKRATASTMFPILLPAPNHLTNTTPTYVMEGEGGQDTSHPSPHPLPIISRSHTLLLATPVVEACTVFTWSWLVEIIQNTDNTLGASVQTQRYLSNIVPYTITSHPPPNNILKSAPLPTYVPQNATKGSSPLHHHILPDTHPPYQIWAWPPCSSPLCALFPLVYLYFPFHNHGKLTLSTTDVYITTNSSLSSSLITRMSENMKIIYILNIC